MHSLLSFASAGPILHRSKERFDEIEGKLTPFLRGCGYNPKKDLIFIPISGKLRGLSRLASAAGGFWAGLQACRKKDPYSSSPSAVGGWVGWGYLWSAGRCRPPSLHPGPAAAMPRPARSSWRLLASAC